MMLMGLDAGALGGYSGTDPALDGAGLARLVASGEARYVLLGGEYSLRGGNRATQAVLRACRELAPSEWHSPSPTPSASCCSTAPDAKGARRRLMHASPARVRPPGDVREQRLLHCGSELG